MVLEPKEWWSLAAVTGVALLACGMTLWPLPYSEVSLMGRPSFLSWMLLGSGAGFLAGLLVRRRFLLPMLTVPAGFMLAVLGRVAVETAKDPTSHNLWPFEVAIAAGVGALAGVAGVGLARLGHRLLGAGAAAGAR
jgi:hypothetical protein